jgi:hypothetical protein
MLIRHNHLVEVRRSVRAQQMFGPTAVGLVSAMRLQLLYELARYPMPKAFCVSTQTPNMNVEKFVIA